MGRRRKDLPPGLAISRPAYDAWGRRWAVHMGIDPRNAQAAWDAEYPKNTLDTIIECRARGLAASEFLAVQFSRRNQLPAVSGVTIWHKAAVDDFCIELADRGYFTREARAAHAMGKTEQHFIEMVSTLAFSSPGEYATTTQEKAHGRTEADFDP